MIIVNTRYNTKCKLLLIHSKLISKKSNTHSNKLTLHSSLLCHTYFILHSLESMMSKVMTNEKLNRS